MTLRIPVRMLGQSGVKIQFPQGVFFIDPYLSDSVEELDARDLVREFPPPLKPADINDADWVLITHAHIDHCDPYTVPDIAKASPHSLFIGPAPVLEILGGLGLSVDRLVLAEESWRTLAPGLRLRAVPAAHPEVDRNEEGNPACVGFLLEHEGLTIYHAGDTSVRQEVIDAVSCHGRIHTAFIPINEDNVYRRRRGIIGNMSVREAFGFAEEIGARQMVPVHWDMFAVNEAIPEEVRAIYRRAQPAFDLTFSPEIINLSDVRISIIIRTLNEARYLGKVLRSIAEQHTDNLGYEVIIVDSGSTDGTVEIAEKEGCRILRINREEFSFGRSLNIGCEAANGDILAIVSGHCVPKGRNWLRQLCQPLLDSEARYSFGRQIGAESSYYSETRIFSKYYPAKTNTNQNEFFCNNANAALHRTVWEKMRFDEELTGLEDMELAKRLSNEGGKIVYVPEAIVYHYHQESWNQVERRYEREAIALQRIMPQLHVSLVDCVRYFASSVYKDWRHAWLEGVLRGNALGVVLYRFHQYRGVYKGNHQHRKLSRVEKEKYFYPE